MMTEYDQPVFDAFLRAILATPDDDLPRLIAADWCEERGYIGEAELLRKQKRIPVDGPTHRACQALLALGTQSRFIRDVCQEVAVWQEKPPTPAEVSRREESLGAFLVRIAVTNDRLSPKQYLWVWRLVLKYRRRGGITPELIERAEGLLPAEIVSAP